jgi:DNA-binding response OmpR family regulator
MKHKIVIVDDDRVISKMVIQAMEAQGYFIQSAFDGKEGVKLIAAAKPDLVILDWNLPEMNGLQICQYIRSHSALSGVGILMLTVFGEMSQKVSAFETGADDYLTKPFDIQELLMRVRSLLRRGGQGHDGRDVMEAGIISVDVRAHKVTVKNKEVRLRPKEFEILCILLKSPGRVLTRQFLLERVWGYDSKLIMTHTVDTHMTRLREQLGAEASNMIQTIPGFGYKFEQREGMERRKLKR